jgi:Domain of Unknown Function (DUF1259)
MRTSVLLAACALGAACAAAPPSPTRAPAPAPAPPPWDSVAAILETPAILAADYVRYDLPRRDLTVRVGDVALAVPLAARGWVGFAGTARAAVVMGDLPVTRAELGPVETELLRQRLDVSAIHDGLVGEEPRLAFIRFDAAGAAVDLARRLDAVLARTGTPRPVTPAVVPPVTIDTAVAGAALGPGGRAQGSVVRYAFQLVRRPVRWRGRVLPPALAAGSRITVQAVNPTRAVATGDFALLASQVQPVLRALAAHGIVATALHTHLVGESPTVYDIHIWDDGPLADVVRGLAAALDAARATR